MVNSTNTIKVGDEELSIDMVLVKMAQLNKRRFMLDKMRKTPKKKRAESGVFSSRKSTLEYQYINKDLDLIKSKYEKVDSTIAAMQIALDKFNQTFEFEVEY